MEEEGSPYVLVLVLCISLLWAAFIYIRSFDLVP